MRKWTISSIAYIESFVGSSQQAIWLQTYYKISSKKSFLKPFFKQTQLALYIPSRIIVHNWWSLWFDILYKKKKTQIELLKKNYKSKAVIELLSLRQNSTSHGYITKFTMTQNQLWVISSTFRELCFIICVPTSSKFD